MKHLLTAVLFFSFSVAFAQQNRLQVLGSFGSGLYRSDDPRAAEIPAFDAATRRAFVVRSFPAPSGGIDVLSLTNPAQPTRLFSIVFPGFAPNSVAIANGIVAVALEDTLKQNPGRVAFFLASQDSATIRAQVRFVTVGALPDMVTFTQDAQRVLTANEGEPNNYNVGNLDPEGSVSIITIPVGGIGTISQSNVQTVGFTDFNQGGPRFSELRIASDAVRIFGPRATVAQDLEPEYVAILGDTAFVSCQENNALITIRISTAQILSIRPFGFKNHNIAGNGLDASDNGTTVNITPRQVRGLYQPDAIAAYRVGGVAFIVTANEGDAREYAGYNEQARGNAFRLDPNSFSDTTRTGAIRNDTLLGRLNLTNALADTTVSGLYRTLYSFGARSFSIFRADADSLRRVFDSGDEMERVTLAQFGSIFNASSSNNTRKNRSDDKGPEPEGVVLGTVGDSVYAFIGLERVGGVMVYNVSNPTTPRLVQYLNNRNPGVTPGAGTVLNGTLTGGVPAGQVGDLGQEGILFVPAAQSPNGFPMVITASEVSGTTTMYEFSNRTTGVTRLDSKAATTFALEQNYPNPFNPSTSIKYQVPSVGDVRLDVFDLLGRKVATLVNERQAAGSYAVSFNAASLSSGVYFYKLTAGAFTQTRKMMLVK
jgi:hypothetical protein